MMMFYEESSNDYGGYGQVPTPTSRREELLSGYEIYRPCTFESLKQFKKVCKTSSAALDCEVSSADGKQYVAFENVTSKNFEDIQKLREASNKTLPAMRILYDRVSEILIVKIIPGSGVFHYVATGLFIARFTRKYPIDSLVGVGATRFEGRDRAKEGDSGYKPITRTSGDAWPSLMVEVGVAGSLNQLRNDARFWLTSGGDTRVVILISINRVAKEVRFERWEDVPRVQPRGPSTPLYNPGMVQSITLEHNVQYAGPALQIPAVKVYDQGGVPPNLGANDFEFTAQDLDSFRTSYWLALQ
ncbi:hypothetical protein KC19_7G096700 [Ceratodon purpureus]|uniref:Uncharacterized protein n=1 Tax=Ceratodon purpureus TaxID=3225 RepID=A0A8T0H6P7_CERPU|nr:hypothetical protein KC19_7G096700 [Ceratodon purpureus]